MYEGMYCLLRNTSGDVFAGTVKEVMYNGYLPSVMLQGVTRLWSWTKHPEGSLSLSSIANHGGGPDSKIDGPTEMTTVFGVREIHVCTPEAQRWLERPRNHE
jgi:hypothetical protein